MDKNKCPILKLQKNFCEIFVVFFDVTEKHVCNYYFCIICKYGNDKLYIYRISIISNKFRIILYRRYSLSIVTSFAIFLIIFSLFFSPLPGTPPMVSMMIKLYSSDFLESGFIHSGYFF